MMKYIFILIALTICLHVPAQNVEVEGTIKLSTSDEDPLPGTIRWNGSDFEGWNGVNWISLTGGATVGTVSDVDENTYKTIKIGDQEWMTENLRTTHFNDETPIDLAQSNSGWSAVASGMSAAYCWFDTTSFNYPNYSQESFGALYNQYAVLNGNLCPEGWRIPGEAEVVELATYLGGLMLAGNKMKTIGTEYWFSPNAGSNSSGFSGLPGGSRNESGGFNTIGFDGTFWTKSTASSSIGKYYYLLWNQSVLTIAESEKGFGFSVRCLKE